MSDEGIYFIYDPGDNGIVTFTTVEERDAFAAKTIENCLDCDEWDSEVARICVGVITGRATRVRVEHRPPDEELDEDGFDEDGTHWPDGVNERFDIEIVPTTAPGAGEEEER